MRTFCDKILDIKILIVGETIEMLTEQNTFFFLPFSQTTLDNKFKTHSMYITNSTTTPKTSEKFEFIEKTLKVT